MNSGFLIILILIAVILILGFILVGIYNSLVKLKNRYLNAFAQIEVQLKRRHDLIPNLVEIAKGYIKHERETLQNVIEARNIASQGLASASQAPGDKGQMQMLSGMEGALTGALGKLFAVMEAYPDLKANQNMAQLSEEITSTENKVTFARQAYNDSVMQYNTYKQTFPATLFANMFGHTEDAGLLEFDSSTIAEPPKVSF